MQRLPLLLAPLLFLLTGCSLFADSEDEDVRSDYESVYAYTAYDSTGQALVEGTLWLASTPSDVSNIPDRLTGSWDLEAKQRDAKTGPQVGEGELEGTVSLEEGEEEIQINLNPHIADDNVFLVGTYINDESGDFVGRWFHEAYTNEPAKLPKGTFKAELVRRPKRTLIFP